MQGEEHEQSKSLLFLLAQGRIFENAYGLVISRALNADLIQYWLNGDFIIHINKNSVFWKSLPYASSDVHLSLSPSHM